MIISDSPSSFLLKQRKHVPRYWKYPISPIMIRNNVFFRNTNFDQLCLSASSNPYSTGRCCSVCYVCYWHITSPHFFRLTIWLFYRNSHDSDGPEVSSYSIASWSKSPPLRAYYYMSSIAYIPFGHMPCCSFCQKGIYALHAYYAWERSLSYPPILLFASAPVPFILAFHRPTSSLMLKAPERAKRAVVNCELVSQSSSVRWVERGRRGRREGSAGRSLSGPPYSPPLLGQGGLPLE